MYRLSVGLILFTVMVMVSLGHHHHHSSDNEFPIVRVSTHLGDIKGSLMLSEEKRPIFAFRGVPYAKPPLGKLRFQNPQPITEPWKGVLDATEDADECLQKDVLANQYIGSEDCLYLNVYSPQLPSEEIPSKKAVMFWVHGGGFTWGSGLSNMYGPTKFLDHDVVLVTINYRLGVMGYLSDNTVDAPGNYGLWDQVQALRWVKENIRQFGGDPDSVTIFGESAGGMSTGYIMQQPAAEGYFHRVISQSGPALMNFYQTIDPVKQLNSLAERTGCNTSDHVVNCLRGVPAAKLNILSSPVKGAPLMFVPVIQPKTDAYPTYLPNLPTNTFSQGKFTKVPFMTGITSDEGECFFPFLVKAGLVSSPADMKERLSTILRIFMPVANDEAVLNQILEKYFPNLADMDPNDVVDNYHKAATDYVFGEPTSRLAGYVAEHGAPTYLYVFDYVANQSLAALVFNSPVKGVPHFDDCGYQFDIPLYGFPRLEGKDREIQNRMLKLWTNFAKNGSPDQDVWHPIATGTTNPSYYKFSTNTMDDNPISGHQDFWNRIIIEDEKKFRPSP